MTDNIISFSDKRKKVEPLTARDELLKVLESAQELIKEGKIEGIMAVATGPDNKVYSLMGGEFDVIQMVGGIETIKHYLIDNTGMDED